MHHRGQSITEAIAQRGILDLGRSQLQEEAVADAPSASHSFLTGNAKSASLLHATAAEAQKHTPYLHMCHRHTQRWLWGRCAHLKQHPVAQASHGIDTKCGPPARRQAARQRGWVILLRCKQVRATCTQVENGTQVRFGTGAGTHRCRDTQVCFGTGAGTHTRMRWVLGRSKHAGGRLSGVCESMCMRVHVQGQSLQVDLCTQGRCHAHNKR